MLSFIVLDKRVRELLEISQEAARKFQDTQAIDPSELEYIRRNAFISMVGASTRIENAVLTDAEIDWLDTVLTTDSRTTAFDDRREFIQDKLSKDKERSIDEVAGSRAMLQLVYSQAGELFPLSETILRGLHDELLRYYDPAAHYRGRYKIAANSVVRRSSPTDPGTPVLETAPPGSITESAMRDLVDWYNTTLPTHPWSIAVATEFVFRFLAIHPFQDGNGRLGRSLFVLALLQSPDRNLRSIVPYLAIDRHIERNREDYYTALRKCAGGRFSADSIKYDYDHFLLFMVRVIQRSFGDFDHYRARYKALQELSPGALAVLSNFKERPEDRMQRSTIIEQTGLPRTTVTDALSMLTRKGFIQRYGKGAGIRYQLVF